MKPSSVAAVLFVISGLAWMHARTPPVTGSAPSVQAPAAKHNAELARMFEADQAARRPATGTATDWHAIGEADAVREARVKEIIKAGSLDSGADYFHAAMILQHASKPEDYLLAHELCIVAIGKGEERAKWLAAATEDRFLVTIGRPQRFGTQYRSGGQNRPLKLDPVDETMTDLLRKQFNAPSLAEARAREKNFEKR